METGLDMVELDRFASAVERCGRRLLSRLFTDFELESDPSVQSLAARFAAKEAFAKALGTGIAEGISWHDIEVVGGGSTRPFLRASGRAAEILGRRSTSLSMTHTASMAAAVVVLDGET